MTDNAAEVGAEFEGFKVPASPFLSETGARQIRRGNYEKPERKLSDKLVQPGDNVLEMGSGIGVFGGLAIHNKPGAKLLSFEANPALVPWINTLYRMNDLDSRAEVRNMIVVSDTDRPDTIGFHIHGSYLGSSVYKVGPRGRPQVDIATTAWDDVKAEFKPHVIIMDIEGAELGFLEHADLSGVRALIIEFHPKRYGPEGVSRCLEALKAQGFKQLHHRFDVRTFVPMDSGIAR